MTQQFVPGVPHVPRKDDTGKPLISMLPWRALQSVAIVMQHGAKKYGRHNYISGGGLDPWRLIDAAGRHYAEHCAGEFTDAESGLPHLAHAAASLLMAIEIIERHNERVTTVQAPNAPGRGQP